MKRHCWLVFGWGSGSVAALRSFLLSRAATCPVSCQLQPYLLLLTLFQMTHSSSISMSFLPLSYSEFGYGISFEFCLSRVLWVFFPCQNRIRSICPLLLTICDNLKMIQESRTWKSERKMVLNILKAQSLKDVLRFMS